MNRFQFVADHRDAFGVKRLCTVLNLSRSGFCRWLKTAPARAAKKAADAALTRRIRKIHSESGKTYGAKRITAELREGGAMVNGKRVERLMRQHGPGIPHAPFHRHYADLIDTRFRPRIPAVRAETHTDRSKRDETKEENLRRLRQENTDLRRTLALYEEAIRQLALENHALCSGATVVPLPARIRASSPSRP
ncbi:IS3 family transposase [Streptomyces sp. NPDC048386]|uniref:IS3 family transposase n=1 Tax=Streptomyces sp. NPDC048386 TaxID=3365541 RepID=UPI00371A1C95